jgi:hypothetical protein
MQITKVSKLGAGKVLENVNFWILQNFDESSDAITKLNHT